MSIENNSLKRKLLIIAGAISVLIGIVGIVIPVLPTTPFLLLAAACFMRSSKRFYSLLLDNKLVGPYVRSYVEGRGMPLRLKIMTIALLWIAIISTVVFAIDNLILKIVLLLIATGVTVHIVLIRSQKKL